MLRKSNDVARYKSAASILQKIAPSDPDARVDDEWADRTSRKVQAETDKLEASLKSYKHNLIKESIRVRPVPDPHTSPRSLPPVSKIDGS